MTNETAPPVDAAQRAALIQAHSEAQLLQDMLRTQLRETLAALHRVAQDLAMKEASDPFKTDEQASRQLVAKVSRGAQGGGSPTANQIVEAMEMEAALYLLDRPELWRRG